MADSQENLAAVGKVTIDDVEMAEHTDSGGGNAEEHEASNATDGAAADDNSADTTTTAFPTRTPFSSYLASPVISLTVNRCSYFAELFAADAGEPRTVDLTDQNLDAVGCFFEFLYIGDYFPRKLEAHSHQLEPDRSVPPVDETGAQLLKHARVYTLAQKLSLPAFQSFAFSKIHRVNSTAKGVIAYARYVYAYTKPEDITVRHPVAKFWPLRSHRLRAEAECKFQALCLEYPQFAYDVLTRVLDEKLKRERDDKLQHHPPPSQGSARNQARSSQLS